MSLRHLCQFRLGIHIFVHISDRSTDPIHFIILRDVIGIIMNIFMIDILIVITLQVLLVLDRIVIMYDESYVAFFPPKTK